MTIYRLTFCAQMHKIHSSYTASAILKIADFKPILWALRDADSNINFFSKYSDQEIYAGVVAMMIAEMQSAKDLK